MNTDRHPHKALPVLYRSRGSLDGVYEPEDRAAFIVGVHNAYVVTLVAFTEDGGFNTIRDVNYGNFPGTWRYTDD